MFADYFGRRKALLTSMVLYAAFTGLTAVSWSWASFLVLRFITGFALGSEWGTGTSLVAETWPAHARAKAAGLMQCGLGLGFFIASACWYFIAPLGQDSWRYMFLIGVLPAVFALWLRRKVPESDSWTSAHRRRRELRQRKDTELTAHEKSFTRLTLRQIMVDPKLRRLTILGSLMSLVTTLGWWGISTWVPAYVASRAAGSGHSATAWASWAGMIYNAGAIAGYIAFGFLADRVGRKPAVLLYFGASLILTPVLFLWTHSLGLIVFVLASSTASSRWASTPGCRCGCPSSTRPTCVPPVRRSCSTPRGSSPSSARSPPARSSRSSAGTASPRPPSG